MRLLVIKTVARDTLAGFLYVPNELTDAAISSALRRASEKLVHHDCGRSAINSQCDTVQTAQSLKEVIQWALNF